MSEWPGYSEWQVMMQEAIELIRKLWSGEKVSFDGIYYVTIDTQRTIGIFI